MKLKMKMSAFKMCVFLRGFPGHQFKGDNTGFTSGRVKTVMYIYVLHIKNLVAKLVADIYARNHCVC